MSIDRVRIVKSHDIDGGDVAGNISRMAAVDEPELWAGLSTVAAGAETGWHHHGTNTTVFHMLAGSLVVEYVSNGKVSGAAQAGDFVVVPPGVIHREIVEGETDVEAVVIRFGDGKGPLVVDVDAPDFAG